MTSGFEAADTTGEVRVPAPMAPERNYVFALLVSDDKDIVGLVAYSIYKQNKLDWLAAFEAATGRVPTSDENRAYVLGEATPRRIAAYLHLARATLEGRGPGAGAVDGDRARLPFVAARRTRWDSGRLKAALAAVAVVAGVAIVVLARRLGFLG